MSADQPTASEALLATVAGGVIMGFMNAGSGPSTLLGQDARLTLAETALLFGAIALARKSAGYPKSNGAAIAGYAGLGALLTYTLTPRATPASTGIGALPPVPVGARP